MMTYNIEAYYLDGTLTKIYSISKADLMGYLEEHLSSMNCAIIEAYKDGRLISTYKYDSEFGDFYKQP